MHPCCEGGLQHQHLGSGCSNDFLSASLVVLHRARAHMADADGACASTPIVLDKGGIALPACAPIDVDAEASSSDSVSDDDVCSVCSVDDDDDGSVHSCSGDEYGDGNRDDDNDDGDKDQDDDKEEEPICESLIQLIGMWLRKRIIEPRVHHIIE